jgi:hypothetical protein
VVAATSPHGGDAEPVGGLDDVDAGGSRSRVSVHGHAGRHPNAVRVQLAHQHVRVVAGHQAPSSTDGHREARNPPLLPVDPHVHLGAPNGDERQTREPEEGEEGRPVEGSADGGEHGEPVAPTSEMLVEPQVEPSAVRSPESQVELQTVVGDLEARQLERRVVDGEQPLAETVVAGRVDTEFRRRVQLDVAVVAVGEEDDPVPARGRPAVCGGVPMRHALSVRTSWL